VEGDRFPLCREKLCHPRFVLVREAPIASAHGILKGA
jgi:hypothetical protein